MRYFYEKKEKVLQIIRLSAKIMLNRNMVEKQKENGYGYEKQIQSA